MNEPQIHCAYDKLVKLIKIAPHPRNPNRHPERQLELLAKVIAEQGWRSPIVVSKRSGYVVAGHGRLEAANRLGLKSAPVNYQDFPSEEAELAHMVADNRLAELAEIDDQALADLLNGMEGTELTGFSEDEIKALLASATIPEGNKPIDEEALAQTKNECPKCQFKW